MALSQKLQRLYDLVPAGAKVVDVGTDHAFLPIALCRTGKASRVIACDIAEKPLQFAKKHLEESDLPDISLRQSDGLQAVRRDEIDTVVMAGMGGEVIAGMMARCAYAKDSGLLWLLQPMTSAESLREYLAANGYEVLRETAVCENKKVYTILSVRYDGQVRRLSPAERFIGRMTGATPEERQYIKKKQAVLEACLNQLELLPDKQQQADAYRQVLREIQCIMENNYGS